LRRLSLIICAAAATSLGGCATDGYGGYYSVGANYGYSPYCDYYSPPWGYPQDYCNYGLWYDPIYYSGSWYSGPIYYRRFAGYNWYWLHGEWRRDQWNGPRPRIDWNDRRNHRWDGDRRRGGGPGSANSNNVGPRYGLNTIDRDRRGGGPEDGRRGGGGPPPNGGQGGPGGGPGGGGPGQGGPGQGGPGGGGGGFGGPRADSGGSGGGQQSSAPPPSPRVSSPGPRPSRPSLGGGGGNGGGDRPRGRGPRSRD
jgi:hypothetical protein